LGRDLRAVRKDGSEFAIEVGIAPIETSDGPAVIASLLDVTQRKQLEADKQLLDELKARNDELTHFAYIASHDLKEPLRKVRAFTERLGHRLGATLDDESVSDMARIGSAVERMKRLIDGLLIYSSSGAMAQTLEPVDLNRIAGEVLSDLSERVESTGATVEVDVLPTIEADHIQMRQLFLNLIGNALKFSVPGRPPKIRVGTVPVRAARALRFFVEDNGAGFDTRHAERIFKPFQRGHSQHDYEGAGIGLAIVSKILQRHRGDIRVRSTLGEGTRFEVDLPLTQSNRDPGGNTDPTGP
ncbi:MAG: PAS domain-containing sensor histidine kinase, partial [Gammaproteobacteria bacterium HGW-Gammaproteobacteria-7]